MPHQSPPASSKRESGEGLLEKPFIAVTAPSRPSPATAHRPLRTNAARLRHLEENNRDCVALEAGEAPAGAPRPREAPDSPPQRSRRASRSDSSRVRTSPSRTGPFTLRMMERLVSSMNSTRT